MGKINKLGMELSTLIILMLLIAGALVVAGIVYKVYFTAEETAHIESCRNSILFVSKGTKASREALPTFRINCPAPHLDYENQDIELDIMKIATDLSNCWYKTAGESNRLGENYVLFVDWLEEDSDICVACSTFTVDKPIFTKQIIDYLNEKDMEVTGWDNDHLFIDPKDDVYMCWAGIEVRPAALECYTGAFKNWGVESVIQPMYKLVPGTTYYIISTNAAKSRSNDFNMVYVVNENDLDEIKCDGDTIFYQQI